MLELTSVRAGYGSFQALFDVSLEVRHGEAVGVIGPNGAGKTTLMRVISGLIRPTAGSIVIERVDLLATPPHRIVEVGIAHVPESRRLFPRMTVYENLLMGAYAVAEPEKRRRSLDFVFGLFPRLAERRPQLAGTLSGGERKMLAIGRALMGGPSLLLVDEPSLGLAPKLTEQVFDALRKLSDDGLTILLVEQNVTATLEMVDRAYVLEQGEIVLEGSAQKLTESEHVKDVYLGVLA